MNNPPLGVVVTFNEWGGAIVAEVAATVGAECGLSAQMINPRNCELVRPDRAIAVFWFVDCPGSSAERAVKRVCQPGDHIVTGFSMPVLLSFCTKRMTMPIDQLLAACRNALERGNICT